MNKTSSLVALALLAGSGSVWAASPATPAAAVPGFAVISNTKSCLQAAPGGGITLAACNSQMPTFWVSDNGRLKAGPGNNTCLSLAGPSLIASACSPTPMPTQMWTYKNRRISSGNMCLEARGKGVIGVPCGNTPNQQWWLGTVKPRAPRPGLPSMAGTSANNVDILVTIETDQNKDGIVETQLVDLTEIPKETNLENIEFIDTKNTNVNTNTPPPPPAKDTIKDIEIRTPRSPIAAMSSSDGTELCIGGSRKAGSQVELVSCDHAYMFIAHDNPMALNRYELYETKPTGLCLDVRGGNAQHGTPVQLYACNSSPAQKWFQADQAVDLILGKAASRISSNVALNLCLDAPGGQKKGTKLVTWACHLSATQQNFRVGAAR